MGSSSARKTAVKQATKGKGTRQQVTGTGDTAGKTRVSRKSSGSTVTTATSNRITPESRWKLIAVSAYHKSQARGFVPGREVEDWLEAEGEIDRLIAG